MNPEKHELVNSKNNEFNILYNDLELIMLDPVLRNQYERRKLDIDQANYEKEKMIEMKTLLEEETKAKKEAQRAKEEAQREKEEERRAKEELQKEITELKKKLLSEKR